MLLEAKIAAWCRHRCSSGIIYLHGRLPNIGINKPNHQPTIPPHEKPATTLSLPSIITSGPASYSPYVIGVPGDDLTHDVFSVLTGWATDQLKRSQSRDMGCNYPLLLHHRRVRGQSRPSGTGFGGVVSNEVDEKAPAVSRTYPMAVFR